jgi:hypothetical protein
MSDAWRCGGRTRQHQGGRSHSSAQFPRRISFDEAIARLDFLLHVSRRLNQVSMVRPESKDHW